MGLANVIKKHLSLALRVAILCSLCNLAVAYDPKVGDMVYIQRVKHGAEVRHLEKHQPISRAGTDRWWHLRSEKLNGMSGEVVRTTSMCSAVRLHFTKSTETVLILNVNLIPEEDAPVHESVEIPDFRDLIKELDRMDSLKVQVDAEESEEKARES